MYSVEEIKELLKAFDESKASALEIQLGSEEYISIRQKVTGGTQVSCGCEPAPAVVAAAPAAPADAAVQEPAAEPTVPGAVVSSPMVGVFYAAPSPDSEPYVTAGSHVSKGDVLCLIEAMKLMNEVTADKSGEITEVCVENGQVVEYGQPLFRIK